MSQLDECLKNSLFANIGNVIVFRTSAKDGLYLAQEMFKDHMPFSYGDFVSMPQYHVIIRMMIERKPTVPFTAETIVYNNFQSLLLK